MILQCLPNIVKVVFLQISYKYENIPYINNYNIYEIEFTFKIYFTLFKMFYLDMIIRITCVCSKFQQKSYVHIL